jgi:hypothetical protein
MASQGAHLAFLTALILYAKWQKIGIDTTSQLTKADDPTWFTNTDC